MPFREAYIKKFSYIDHCEFCLDELSPGVIREHHSASSLHLEPRIIGDELRFLVTDTTLGHKALETTKRTLPASFLTAYFPNNPRDLWVACLICHDSVHKIEALIGQKLNFRPYIKSFGLSGTITTPEILLSLTASLVGTGQDIVVEEQFNRFMAIYFPNYL